MLSGREEAGPGQLAPVSVRDLESAWDHLTVRYASEFDPPRGQLLAWAQRGAAECEVRELWAGAIRHVGVLLSESAGPALYARRGKARAEMRQYEGALADYGKALETGPGLWVWWAGRGAAAASLGRWEQAVEDLTRAAQLEERHSEVWLRLGQVQAERGQWKKSADALAKAIRFGAADPAVWYDQALAQLSAGDVKGYRRTCGRLVKKFGDREEPAVRRVVADACVLGPAALPDFKPLLDRAEKIVRASPKDMEEHARLAGLLLRSRHARCATVLLEICAADGHVRPVEQWLLVLAYQKSAQAEKAKEVQDRVSKQKPHEGATWQERQVVVLWEKEANEPVKSSSK